MADLARIDQLARDLSKYEYLRVWVDDAGLNVHNLNNNKQLTLYREPELGVWGIIEDKNNGFMKNVLKPQFDRALNHLYRIASEIQQ
jgi:hypothetical protein